MQQGPKRGATERGLEFAEAGQFDFEADLEEQEEKANLAGLHEHLADLGIGHGRDEQAEHDEERERERGTPEQTAEVGHAHEQQDQQDDDFVGVHRMFKESGRAADAPR